MLGITVMWLKSAAHALHSTPAPRLPAENCTQVSLAAKTATESVSSLYLGHVTATPSVGSAEELEAKESQSASMP